MHSPWGMIGQLCDNDPAKMKSLMENVSWANIQMMMADKVRLVKRKDIIIKVSKEEMKLHRQQYRNG